MTYTKVCKGNSYTMGISGKSVHPGDVIKLNSGRLEEIVAITPIGDGGSGGVWDRKITTSSGREYGMMDVSSYGRKDKNG